MVAKGKEILQAQAGKQHAATRFQDDDQYPAQPVQVGKSQVHISTYGLYKWIIFLSSARSGVRNNWTIACRR